MYSNIRIQSDFKHDPPSYLSLGNEFIKVRILEILRILKSYFSNENPPFLLYIIK